MKAHAVAQPRQAHQASGRKVLVSAASKQGATAQIARSIAETLTGQGLIVTLLPPENVDTIEGYDAAIIGSAVYAGHWLEPAKDLVYRCRDALVFLPVWLFSSGPVGDPATKMAQALGRDPFDLPGILLATQARDHRMFPGKLDRNTLTRPQRATLRVFPGLAGDFRDWAEIRQWALGIAGQLAPVPR